MEKVITMQVKHQKHGKTKKANFGGFGRNELAILGTPCGNIKELSLKIIEGLSTMRIAYADSDHKTEEKEKSDFLKAGAEFVYTNKIDFHRFELKNEHNKFIRNQTFSEFDLVLVNGNHFTAKSQILFIDARKSLEKKLDRITNPVLIILTETDSEIPNYLIEHNKSIQHLPKYHISEFDKIIELIRNQIEFNIPKLKGLVLAGGKSTRMQRDKGIIEYHGAPQREYLLGLLSKFMENNYISLRKDQLTEFTKKDNIIVDSIDDLGPYGAILSAFREYPNSAWLVIACDLPLLSKESISQLITNRDPSKIATAFNNEKTGFPEPLITIWEPKAYPLLLHFFSLGYSCPRKVLINSNIKLVDPTNNDELRNVNNQEDFNEVIKLI